MSIARRTLFLSIPIVLLVAISLLRVGGQKVAALTADEQLSQARDVCENRALQMVREERDAYRRVQYNGEGGWSVLGVEGAKTSDLVPYLVLNYHALSCRLRSVCDAVELSHGHVGADVSVLPHRPIGCSRLFAARGRWWSDEHRKESSNSPLIAECNYRAMQENAAEGVEVTFDYFTVGDECQMWVEQILLEERQMLRLLVAQDSAQRGTRQVVSVFQAVLQDVRENFLEPLRGMVDLFGSVIHPIPCLLTQCN